MSVRVCVFECACVCMWECERVYVRECVCMNVSVRVCVFFFNNLFNNMLRYTVTLHIPGCLLTAIK